MGGGADIKPEVWITRTHQCKKMLALEIEILYTVFGTRVTIASIKQKGYVVYGNCSLSQSGLTQFMRHHIKCFTPSTLNLSEV